MTFKKNANHIAEGLLKFAAPFWGKPRWAALFVAIAREIQELENMFWDVISKRMLDNATGAQLRVLGRIVGQADPGLGEDVFRMLIRVRIRINRSVGLLRDLLEVLQLMGVEGTVAPAWPAKVRLDCGAIPLPPDLFRALLEETLAGGVGIVIVLGDEDGFEFQDDGSADPSGDFGDDIDPDMGAPWTSVV